MEDKILTGQESLDLIAKMIRNTQDRFERYSGTPFIVWGYSTIVIALVVWYFVSTTGNMDWNYLWFGIIPLGGITMSIFRRKREKYISTYTDQVTGYIWLVIGVTAVLTAIVASFGPLRQVLFIEALLINIGTALTGLVIRLRYVAVMGFAGVVVSFCLPFFERSWYQVLIFALIVAVTMVVPGHIMNAQGRKYNRIGE